MQDGLFINGPVYDYQAMDALVLHAYYSAKHLTRARQLGRDAAMYVQVSQSELRHLLCLGVSWRAGCIPKSSGCAHTCHAWPTWLVCNGTGPPHKARAQLALLQHTHLHALCKQWCQSNNPHCIPAEVPGLPPGACNAYRSDGS